MLKRIDMKKILLLISAIVLLTSCENEKKYRYIETVRELSIVGGPSTKEKDEKIISAQTDSAAYIEAYRHFCISQKAYSELRKKGMGEYLGIPIGFKQYLCPRIRITKKEGTISPKKRGNYFTQKRGNYLT